MSTIGFLGFGEVAYTFANRIKDFTNGKAFVYAFDVNQNNEWQGEIIRNHAKEANVTLVENTGDLVGKADIIIGLVPAKFAVSSAEELANTNNLNGNKTYCDFSSASPMDKKHISGIIEITGASFIDGAIMGSMLSYGYKAPIFLSGTNAEEIVVELKGAGLNVRTVGKEPGAASTIKMLRSSFTKGIESLIFETFYAASKFEVEDTVLEVLADTFDNESFEKSVNRYITSSAIHAERRVEEVKGVINLLKSIDIEPYMAQGAFERLSWVSSMELREAFKGTTPNNYHDVFKVLNDKGQN